MQTRKSKKQVVAEQLVSLGFEVSAQDFVIVRGPKAKSDIIECWHVYGQLDGKKVEISSCHTLTELAARGIALESGNSPEAQIYGDYLVVPKPYGKTLVQLFEEGKL